MTKKIWLSLLVAACAVTFGSLVYASEILVPPTQLQQGKGALLLYYGNSDQKLSFQVRNKDEIRVGSISYFSDVTNDFESKGRSRALTAKYIVNPHEGLYYWVKAGIGSYELEIPSSSITNELSGQDRGWLAGTGFRARLFPDTIVTPSVAAEAGITYSQYGLDTFRAGGGAPMLVRNQLELTEIQAAVIFGKRISRTEIYGGLKIFRTYALLRDKAAVSSVSGSKDNAGAFLGAKFRLYPKESLVIEASAVGETSVSAGWSIDF